MIKIEKIKKLKLIKIKFKILWATIDKNYLNLLKKWKIDLNILLLIMRCLQCYEFNLFQNKINIY